MSCVWIHKEGKHPSLLVRKKEIKYIYFIAMKIFREKKSLELFFFFFPLFSIVDATLGSKGEFHRVKNYKLNMYRLNSTRPIY